jgi:hypothetical protein
MGAFDRAWALLKGQYMHPSVMGHFARGSMVREADDSNEYAFDDFGDPANAPTMFSGTPADLKHRQQQKIAEKSHFENAAEMREAGFRPRVREQAMSIPQEEVEAFIQNRLVNPPVIPAKFHPSAYPGERALSDSMLDGPDEINLKRLIAAKQGGHYDDGPEFGLSEPTDRRDLFQPDQ